MRGQLWPVCGRAWYAAGVAGALCGRCANWRGLWPCMARVFAGFGAGCIGARVVAGAGCVPFNAKKYCMHLQWHFA